MWQIQRVLPAPIIGIFVFRLRAGDRQLSERLHRPHSRSEKSIVMPASACPKCGAPIRPYDNIPVLSWLLLGGKCRACKTQISRDVSAGRVADGGCFFRMLSGVWADASKR